MRISIDASGSRVAVKHAIAAQIDAARRDSANQYAGPVIAAVGDDIHRRIRNVPGTEFSVHADVIIDIKVTKATEADVVEPAIVVNGERITRADFDHRVALAEAERIALLNPPVDAPIIGTAAVGSGTLIHSDEEVFSAVTPPKKR